MPQQLAKNVRGPLVLAACWVAIFWPGAFVFGLPGVLSGFWQQTFGVGHMAIGRVLFCILTSTGIFMFVTGRIQDRIGPTKLAIAGAVINAAAPYLLVAAKSMQMVYLWAFITGGASCLLYLPVITVAQLWYPGRRGLASGIVNLSFGLSSAIMAPVFNSILHHAGHVHLIIIISCLSLGFGIISALFIRRPDTVATGAACTPGTSGSLPCAAPMQSLKTRNFWLIWVTYATAGAAGISMVTHAVGFGLARGLSATQAILILSAFSLTNGLSRVISGYISDSLGRKQTLAVTFLLSGLAYYSMNHLEGLTLWLIWAAVIGFAFGTLFAVSAPLLSDIFGMAYFGTIFGMIFTAYGFFAGVLGPWVSGYWLDLTGSNFTIVFTYLGTLSLIAAVMIGFVKQSDSPKSG
ncbi:MAG: MFS transporter [Desulfobacteraceae bacterium]|nr:MFS transporter [Desulfobacteraceae bacterium]